jgi:hypothetical protein
MKKPQDQRQSHRAKKITYPVEHMAIDHNTDVSAKSKNNDLVYLNRLHQEKTWMNEAKLERFTTELIAWAQTPEATKLSLFLKMKGATYEDVETWCDRWPEFKKTLQFVKEMIGDRREDGGLRGLFSERMVIMSMPLYDREWKEESNRLAAIRDQQQVAESKRPIIIQMTDYSEKKIGEK